MRVRFLQPIYEGDEIVAALTDNLASACRQDGTVCATGEVFWTQAEPPSLAWNREESFPRERPPASSASLAPGRILGTVRAKLSLPDHAFLAMQDEALTLYQEGILHPAALLSLSNQVLIQNVKLGRTGPPGKNTTLSAYPAWERSFGAGRCVDTLAGC